jgi:hypothetical protein
MDGGKKCRQAVYNSVLGARARPRARGESGERMSWVRKVYSG